MTAALVGVYDSRDAYAASYGCSKNGYPSRSFSVNYSSVNAMWAGVFDTARSRWNNASVSASISRKDSASASMNAGYYEGEWFGKYTSTTVLGKVTKFQINMGYLVAKGGNSRLSDWGKSTTAHELGHALRLLDNPNTKDSSLMKHSRDRSKVGSPTTYDKANVKACY